MFHRFSRFPFTALFALLLLLVSILHAGDEKLVPAQLSPRTDSGGSLWDIHANGYITDGSNDCFDNGAVLLINNRDFNANERKQTADGSELVLSGKSESFSIIRRILVDNKRNAARYLEMVTNTGKQKQKIVVTIRSNLGNQAMQSSWNDGKSAANGPLPKKCVALAAITQSGDSRPGVVWIIGEAGAATPPTIEIANQRTYSISYSFELAPQHSRAVLHYVLQRPGLQPTQIAEQIKSLWKGQLVKPVMPTAYKSMLINFRSGAGPSAGEETEAPPRLPVIAALLERAGVEDTATKTLVGVGRSEAERMTGSLSGGPLIATSEYGAVTITVDELAGAEGSDFRTLLHLRSGETIAAHDLKGALRLETEAGVELPVDPAHVAWLVSKRAPNEGLAPADQLGVLLLTDGSRLAVSTTTAALPVISAFGQATVAFDQLATIQRMNEPPGWMMTMRDGSRLRVLPATKELAVATCRFGMRQLLTARIAGYLRSGKVTIDEDREDGAQLESGERFYAGLAGTTLTLTANGADTAIPIERITALENPENSSGLSVVLRDGGRLVGATKDGTIALLAGGQTWRVPIRRLLHWQAPPPKPDAPEPAEAPEAEQDVKKSTADADKKPAAPAAVKP